MDLRNVSPLQDSSSKKVHRGTAQWVIGPESIKMRDIKKELPEESN